MTRLMGTNFYLKTPPEDFFCDEDGDYTTDDPAYHVGKRSASGKWCWACNRTLCVSGPEDIHKGTGAWYDVCPRCGHTDDVAGSSSWTWAMAPLEAKQAIIKAGGVVDEYGRESSPIEFYEEVLAPCRVVFRDSIGRWFS